MSVRNTSNFPFSVWEVPTRVPDMERLGEDIVVHEASVNGEDAHQKDDVSPTEKKINTGRAPV